MSVTKSNGMNMRLITGTTNLKPRHYWAVMVILAYDFSAFRLWESAFPGYQRIGVSVFCMIITTPNSYINHLAFSCDRTDRMKNLEL